MIKEKKRAVAAFGLIYVLFFAVLVHFLFSPGLSFTKIGNELFIKNEGIRNIRGIRVYDEQGKTIDCIGELGQANSAYNKAKIFLPEDETIKILKASAPFHPEISTRVVKASDEESKFHVSIGADSPPKPGKEYALRVEVCNFSEDVDLAKLEIEFSEQFFSGEGKTVSFPLKKGDCREARFSLTPLKAGKTVIAAVLTTPKVIKREETIITIGA